MQTVINVYLASPCNKHVLYYGTSLVLRYPISAKISALRNQLRHKNTINLLQNVKNTGYLNISYIHVACTSMQTMQTWCHSQNELPSILELKTSNCVIVMYDCRLVKGLANKVNNVVKILLKLYHNLKTGGRSEQSSKNFTTIFASLLRLLLPGQPIAFI